MRTAIEAHVNLYTLQCSTVPVCAVVDLQIKNKNDGTAYNCFCLDTNKMQFG